MQSFPDDPARPPDRGTLIDPEVLDARRARRRDAGDGLEVLAARLPGPAATEARERAAAARVRVLEAERDGLRDQLHAAELALREAAQREFSEQQLRREAQEELAAARREAEREVAGVRAALRAVQDRARELAAALGAPEAAPGGPVAHDAITLERTLAAERAARRRAEARLEAEHERAAAEVTLLQHELDLRTAGRATLAAELVALRSELDAARVQAAAREGELAAARALERDALAAVVAAAEARLADALAELGAERERVAAAQDVLAGLPGPQPAGAQTTGAGASARGSLFRAPGTDIAGPDSPSPSPSAPGAEPAGPARRPLFAAPGAEHPALTVTVPGAPATAAAVIDDLARAADRLRTVAAPAANAARPGERVTLAARRAPGATPAPSPWLTGALVRLSGQDPAAATRLLPALLGAQASRLGRELEYTLAIAGAAPARVALGADGTLALRAGAAPDAAFALSGTPAALAPLAGGGARRLPGAQVSGSRRRLRRLLRAMRAPVGLGELVAAGADPEPLDLLALIADAIEPARTAGHTFAVAFDLAGAEPLVAHLAIADGAPVSARAGRPPRVAATIHLTRQLLPAFLHGQAPATVAGDAAAAHALCAWIDGAQGHPA